MTRNATARYLGFWLKSADGQLKIVDKAKLENRSDTRRASLEHFSTVGSFLEIGTKRKPLFLRKKHCDIIFMKKKSHCELCLRTWKASYAMMPPFERNTKQAQAQQAEAQSRAEPSSLRALWLCDALCFF